MSIDFMSRMIGMVVCMVIGAQFGASNAEFLNYPPESSAFLFGLVGILFGVIITPWLTVWPVRSVRRAITEWPVERLLLSIVGVMSGLLIALLAAYPMSFLPPPFGTYLPIAFTFIMAYLGLTIFGGRSREILDALRSNFKSVSRTPMSKSRKLLLDTSVLIDGRIIEISETGFIGGTLLVPRFVLSELHRVADSSDPLRRNRGRRGLNMLNKLQRTEAIPVRIIDDDPEDVPAVDDKLVALALEIDALVVTNDYNLNQVADAQGVMVLNINQLSNAVRSIYIPGETFPIRIIQEGSQENQGIGYLDDGTMVVVEHGKNYMDRTIDVEVTKLINKETGRMIFAIPESEKSRYAAS